MLDVTAKLEGNIGVCNKCGLPSRVRDGTFEFVDYAIREIYGEQLTKEAAQFFSREAKKTRSKDAAVFLASSISPKVAKVVAEERSGYSWEQRLVMVAAVVTILAGAPSAYATVDHAARWAIQKFKTLDFSQEEDGDLSEKQKQPEESQDGKPDEDPEDDLPDDNKKGWDGSHEV